MAFLGVQPLNAQVILHGKLSGEENNRLVSVLGHRTVGAEDHKLEPFLFDPLQHGLQGGKDGLGRVICVGGNWGKPEAVLLMPAVPRVDGVDQCAGGGEPMILDLIRNLHKNCIWI